MNRPATSVPPGRGRQVVMIGPSPLARGGMATVIDTLLKHGYCDGGRCRFIATHIEGSAWRKAMRAAASLLQFLLLLLKNDVALLHVHVASGVSFWRKSLFILGARVFRVPILFHLHGGEFRDFIEQRLSGWRQKLALRIIGMSCAAFALTRASGTWLRERCGVEQVEVFPNPVALPIPLPREACSEVLYIGRLEEKKGVFDLLTCFPAVLAARSDAILVLAGDGDQGAVMALASELGIVDRVRMEGWVEGDRKAQLLARASVFVLPSWHEQMPMVVIEAMAAGTPVVATAVGAVPDMLLHGSAGMVVPPKDSPQLAAAILRIMDDNILRDMYSMSGLALAQSEYRVEGVLTRLRRRYEELAA